MTAQASTGKRHFIIFAVFAMTIVLATACAFIVGCAPQQSQDADNAPSQTDESTGMEGQPINWKMESDCATCHTTESGMMDDAAHPQSAAHKSESCISCHTEESVLATAHEGKTFEDVPASKATVVSVSEKACAACHGEIKELADQTIDSTALTDSKGKSVNPHQIPEGNSHTELNTACTDCHKVHGTDLSKDAMKYCAQCHHRGIFECGTCHEKK